MQQRASYIKDTILLIEDEKSVREVIAESLSDTFQVLCAGSGAEGVAVARTARPRLVLLDLIMPGMGGMEVCKKLREAPETRAIPIIAITGSPDDELRSQALLSGVDDLVAKPFGTKEMKVRILGRLSREPSAHTARSQDLELGKLKLDYTRIQAWVDNQPLSLTGIEFAILGYLARHPSQIISRSELIKNVWKPGEKIAERTVDTHVYHLRRKIEGSGLELTAVYGAGYTLRPVGY